jgi:hypothetical protein
MLAEHSGCLHAAATALCGLEATKTPPVAIQLPAGRKYREALGQGALLSSDGTTLTLAANQSAVLVWS